MHRHGIQTYAELVARSVNDPAWFWDATVRDLDIRFSKPYTHVLDLSGGIEWPRWFVGGEYNYVHDAVDKWTVERSGASEAQALIWEGEDGEVRTLTYREIHSAVNRAANALKSLGVGKGDRVGIFMPMLPETAIAVLAVSKIGAVYTPIFSGYGAPAVAGRLGDCQAKLLITADGFLRGGKRIPMGRNALEAAQQAGATVEHILMVQRVDGSSIKINAPGGQPEIHWWHDLVPAQSDVCETERTAADAPYMIIYTSGTTGRPKGVVHVHSGFPIKAAQELAHCFDLHAGERLFWFSDLGWMMGPWAITGTLMLGATCFLYEGAINHPHPDRIWDMVERHRVTHLGIAPTAIRTLMGSGDGWVEEHDLSSLVVLAGAGEPWNPAAWEWYMRVVGKGEHPIINYSGGTEVSGGILAGSTLLPSKPCTFGGPVPGMAADVIDHDGNPVRGGVGELALRASWPGITRGFWEDPTRYLDTYWRRVPGLWVHGDWATVDEDGFWRILGRSDDTVKVAGKRIGPAEVESAALSHPAVAEAAAIGIPDEVKGESLAIFVRAHTNDTGKEQLRAELDAHLTAALGKALRPGLILIVQDLPRTRNGKILRRLVRAAYLGEPPGDLSALENPSSLDEIAALRA
jgi:acetyl-CoA synthetase